MRYFGTVIFGSLAAIATLGVVWIVYAYPFWLILAPIFWAIFAGPFALLVLMSFLRRRQN